MGQALREALGDKVGITRFGDALVPLDEVLAQAVVDVSGRPYCVHEEPPLVELIGTYDTTLDPSHLGVDDVECADLPARPGPRRTQRPPHRRGAVQSRRAGAARGGLDRPSFDGSALDQGRAVTATAPSVVIVDYGSGNLRSAERALAHVGAAVEVTSDLAAAAEADGVVLPGVGAFAACMEGVMAVGADDADPRAGRRRPAGPWHLCRHAGALPAPVRSTVSRTSGIGALAGERRAAGGRSPAAHGLEHRARRRLARPCSRGWRGSASTSSTPMACIRAAPEKP